MSIKWTMPEVRQKTRARVIFERYDTVDNSERKPAQVKNKNFEDKTPSNNNLDAVEDHQLTDTIKKILSINQLAILTGKDVILKEVLDCVIRKVETRLKKISPCIYSL